MLLNSAGKVNIDGMRILGVDSGHYSEGAMWTRHRVHK